MPFGRRAHWALGTGTLFGVSEMNRCTSCGQEIRDGTHQCPSCGEGTEGEQSGQVRRRTNLGKAAMVIGAVLLGVGAAITFFAWSWTVHRIADALFLTGFLLYLLGAVILQWREYRRGRPTTEALKEFVKTSYFRLLIGILIMAVTSIVFRRLQNQDEKSVRPADESHQDRTVE